MGTTLDPTIANASRVTVETGAELRADSTQAGDGGLVSIWSDNVTNFNGLISVRGGPLGGNGGLIQIRGRLTLGANHQFDLSALRGSAGRLILIPPLAHLRRVNQHLTKESTNFITSLTPEADSFSAADPD